MTSANPTVDWESRQVRVVHLGYNIYLFTHEVLPGKLGSTRFFFCPLLLTGRLRWELGVFFYNIQYSSLID